MKIYNAKILQESVKELQRLQSNSTSQDDLSKFKPMISVFVEWKTRNNGVKPKNSVITNDLAKKRCAAMLVDFYETRISLQFNNQNASSQQ